MQVTRPVDALRALDAAEVRREADARSRGPVVPGPEFHRLVSVPVPGPDDRPGGGDAQRPLHGGPVLNAVAEGEDDRHADAVHPVVGLEDRGVEDLVRGQRPERAGHRRLLASGACHRRQDRVGLRHSQRRRAVPDRAVAGQLASDGVAGHPDLHALDMAMAGGDRDSRAWADVARTIGGRDRQAGNAGLPVPAPLRSRWPSSLPPPEPGQRPRRSAPALPPRHAEITPCRSTTEPRTPSASPR